MNAEAVTPVVVHTVVADVSLQRFLVRELFLGLRSVRHDSDDQVERFLTDTVASYIQPGRVARVVTIPGVPGIVPLGGHNGRIPGRNRVH